MAKIITDQTVIGDKAISVPQGDDAFAGTVCAEGCSLDEYAIHVLGSFKPPVAGNGIGFSIGKNIVQVLRGQKSVGEVAGAVAAATVLAVGVVIGGIFSLFRD